MLQLTPFTPPPSEVRYVISILNVSINVQKYCLIILFCDVAVRQCPNTAGTNHESMFEHISNLLSQYSVRICL